MEKKKPQQKPVSKMEEILFVSYSFLVTVKVDSPEYTKT